MANVTITRGSTLPNSAAKSDFHALVDSATGTVANIVNADIDSAAAIANSKLNLASVSQDIAHSGAMTHSGIVTMSSKILKLAKGADVASTAGTITLGDDGNYFDITGTAAITGITAKTAGTRVTLQFDSTASLVDGGNLKLNGNLTGAAEVQITLTCDGTNWFEDSRSNAGTPASASQANMEAASDNSVMVTPLAMKWHPGVAKAWCVFNGTGTPAMTTNYNMDASITDNGTGDWTVSFTTDFSSANYAITGMANRQSSTDGCFLGLNSSSTFAAGTVRIVTTLPGGSQFDSSYVSLVAFGDQ